MSDILIYIWVHHTDGVITEPTHGLAAEAARLIQAGGRPGSICALAMGEHFEEPLQNLGACGVERVMRLTGGDGKACPGERQAGMLAGLLKQSEPFLFLMAHDDETADLAPRLAAAQGLGLVTRAADLRLSDSGGPVAMRFIADGHLGEEIKLNGPPPYVVTFLPSVLKATEPLPGRQAEVLEIEAPPPEPGGTELVEVIQTPAADLDIQDAEIVLACGRGVGKEDGMADIERLAEILGASLGGTRPLVDWHLLPYERQIGQTGQSVAPRLIINCGISGANEYTVGMEKARASIAINIDPNARIFRFCDLGVVGDLRQVLPLLIQRLQKLQEGEGEA